MNWMLSGDGHARPQQPASSFTPLALSTTFPLSVVLQANQRESHLCPIFCKLYGLAQCTGLVSSLLCGVRTAADTAKEKLKGRQIEAAWPTSEPHVGVTSELDTISHK